MQIIDWQAKGNVVRFYLGKNGPQTGDDWDDTPYDCNAGCVYGEFIEGHQDVMFPFEVDIVEPNSSDYYGGSIYCKDDFKKRITPCLIVVPGGMDLGWEYSFSRALGVEGAKRFYFGDEMEPSETPLIFAF